MTQHTILESIEASLLTIPFQEAFKHASAERSQTQTLWVVCRTAVGNLGVGEGCPREYVTNEGVASVLAFVTQYRDEWCEHITDLHSLRAWVTDHRQEIDANPAAWCAVELAILDALGKDRHTSLETLLGQPALMGAFQYSAVLGDASSSGFQAQLARYLKTGFADFKIKLSGDLAKDKDKVAVLRAAGIPANKVRADANNLWTNAEAAIAHMQALDFRFMGLEEPLQGATATDLKTIAETLQTKIILDESLLRLAQLPAFMRNPQHWVVNLRVSKMGGLLRSFELLGAIRSAGLGLIIGAHVGETSVLTRAALSVANSARDILLGQEGAFGTHLLSHDVTPAPLMFGQGGVLDITRCSFDSKPGLGLVISS